MELLGWSRGCFQSWPWQVTSLVRSHIFHHSDNCSDKRSRDLKMRVSRCAETYSALAEINTINSTEADDRDTFDAVSDKDNLKHEDPLNSVPLWLNNLMPYMGVLPEALTGWSRIFERPHVVFLCSTTSNVCTLVINSSVLLFASRPFRWGHHSFAAAYTLLHTMSSLMILRWGLAVAKTWIYYAVLCAAIFIQFPLAVKVMLGPTEHVPFENRLVFALINSIALWFWTFTSTTGTWAPDHPPKPFEFCSHSHSNSSTAP